MNEMEADRILADAFLASHPADAARTLEDHPLPALAALLSECAAADIARVVASMDPVVASAALTAIDEGRAARIFAALPPSAASGLLRRAAPELRERMLERLPARTAAGIRARLEYPTDTAGALLDPDVLTAPPERSVAEAQQRLQRANLRSHAYLFVVDPDGVLLGVIGLGEVFGAAPEARLGALARHDFEPLQATAGRDAILTHPVWRDLQPPPVVDGSGRLLGVLRYAAARTLAAEAHASAGAAGAVLEFGEMAWSTGIGMAAALAGALTARGPAPASPSRAGREEAGR